MSRTQLWGLLLLLTCSFLFAPKAAAFCGDGSDFTATGQETELIRCEAVSLAGNNQNVTLGVPPSAVENDLLIAVVNLDGDRDFTTVPAGWTPMIAGTTVKSGTAVTMGVWYKVVTTAEPANYTWGWGANEQVYAYMMRLRGGGIPFIVSTANSGGNNQAVAVAPSVTTTIPNSMVLRLAVYDDDDYTGNNIAAVAGSGTTTITRGLSAASANSVSADAGYFYQTNAGATGTANFAARDASEAWAAMTIAIRPNFDYRFIHTGVASVCSSREVTIQATRPDGSLISQFARPVSLAALTAPGNVGQGTWSNASVGTVVDSGSSNGNATYQFSAANAGQVTIRYTNTNTGNKNFNASTTYGAVTYAESAAFDPQLAIDNLCSFVVTHDGSAGTCAMEPITVTLRDSSGIAATNYTGTATVTVTNDPGPGLAGLGLFTLGSGAGVFNGGGADDDNGSTTYAYSLNDVGVVSLNLAYSTIQSIRINVTGSGYTTSNDGGALEVAGCELRFVIPDLTKDVCSVTTVTLQATDTSGNLITTFNGSVELSSSANAGTWSILGGNGSIGASVSGIATYTFNTSDGGDVDLGYQLTSTNPSVNFNATSNGFTSPIGVYDPNVEIVVCTVLITQSGGGTLTSCSSNGINITYTVRDRDNATATGFTGTVALTATGTLNYGDWVSTAGSGTLNNGTLDDGVATYQYVAADAGTVVIKFTNKHAQSTTLGVTANAITVAGGSQTALTVTSCTFRITHGGTTDVCSIAGITIAVVDSGGNPITDYLGTVNLSTTTNHGTWAINAGNGTVVDPVAGDGSATYNFVSADNGTVSLNFRIAFVETTNINVSDGGTTDPANPANMYDQNLVSQACTFRIIPADLSFSACASVAVTITAHDRNGAQASNFLGTVNISTSTLNGSWSINAGVGTLNETPFDDNGAASYTFVSGDSGQVILDYQSPHVQAVNIDLLSGTISEAGAYDPNLSVTGCSPSTANLVCSTTGTAVLPITARNPDPALGSRMVVMMIFYEGTIPTGDVTAATFNAEGMTRIHREVNAAPNQVIVDMWGIVDSALPVTAGSYPGTFTGGENTPAMCLLQLNNVTQTFPSFNAGSPVGGLVNGSQADSPASGAMATTITTAVNNSIVISAGVNSNNAGGGNRVIEGTDPSPPMTFLNNNILPNSATASISSGVKATVGPFTVTDTDNTTPNAYAHLVAAFGPFINGAAIVEGFVPLELFRSYAGSANFKVIGRSLRRTSNGSPDGGTGAVGCQLVDSGTGNGSTLSMPTGSTVQFAYLYWAGSGDTANIDRDISFGPTGSESPISAEEIFQVLNVGGSGTLNYFAGYKDVTAQVTGNGNYTFKNLDVQFGNAWDLTSACAGGWGLVVVYSNPNERLRTVNLFQGFQPVQNSSVTTQPRNFRAATIDPSNNLPNAQVAHITIEGDEAIGSNAESLSVQDAPNSGTFAALPNSFNPLNSEFNSTVTRPIFAYDSGTGFYEFQPSAGINADGYEIDFPGTDALLAGRTGNEIGTTWGFDTDTHYVAGSQPTDILYPFAQPGTEQEELSVRYASGQDLVLLLTEVFAITNYPMAELEIFKSVTSTYRVGGTGTYQLLVTNNGDNTSTGGSADGKVIVADTLPSGMTLASAGDVAGTNWDCSAVTLNPGAFTCIYDIDTNFAGGQLPATQSLPPINVAVQIGNATFFPNLDNNVKNVARMTHVGSTGCVNSLVPGLIPPPSDCARSPQFDNRADLQGGSIDINNVNDKAAATNNNVDSVIHVVKGVQTDLGINKVVNGILETGASGSYTLTVVNNGPDATTAPITVLDTVPAGVTFDSASGTGWVCSTSPNLNCTYAGSLAYLQQAPITLNVTVTGAAAENVTNTAQVSTGPFNFDIIPANDASTVITAIVAPEVASQERFLMSVSATGNDTTIGGVTAVSNFENHDYIIYDPAVDKGSMFFDNSVLGFSVNDANAVHLYKNGDLAISAASASSVGVGSNLLAFQPEDIVRYDPIKGTAIMLFDGSQIFDGPISSDHNIDAVYVRDDGRIVFSTVGPASITYAGPTTVSFARGDIVEYNPVGGTATILVNADDANIFGVGSDVQVDSLYIRVDATNPDLNRDVYILSVAEASATIGACGSCSPVVGITLTRDDIVELNLSGANPVTELLFSGDQPLGVFVPSDPARTIDALHVVEDGYIGHFSISQFQSGNVCTPAQVRISKHRGLTHNTDTDYFGTIKLSTDTGFGDWSLATGNGTLDNGAADDGEATYTFVASDNGVVTLYFTEDTVGSTINFNVTNGLTLESGAEDPNFTFNAQVTNVTFRDEFSAAAFNNNNGSTFWETDWVEVDDEGAGPAAGNISISGGVLAMTSSPATVNAPRITRTADLTNFLLTEDIFINFTYSFASLNSAGDAIQVQVSADGTESNFVTVETLTGASFSGTNGVPQAYPPINITSTLAGNYTNSMAVRFVISQGYTGTSVMYLDNIEVVTGTTDCGIGSIEHYEIRIENLTGPANTLIPGIACLGSVVTISGHDANHFPAASDELLTLRGFVAARSNNFGNWSIISGAGGFNGLVAGNGVATYDLAPTETSASFLYQYTGPTTDPQNVNFNLDSAYPVNIAEDPTLQVRQAGLLFYNEGLNTSVNSIATQIAGKPSDTGFGSQTLTLEAVRTNDQNPLACSPLFDVGTTVQIEFGAECSNPASCATNTIDINGNASVPVTNDNAAPGASSYSAAVPVLFQAQPNSGHPAGTVNFTYNDVGEIRLHARYRIPFASNSAPSADYMSGESNTFVVRPFGFAVDFSDDRINGTNNSVSADHTSPPFFTAGEAFNTTVRAVVWDSNDDVIVDGVPDIGANLYDNAVTPNFGNEITNATTDFQVRVNLSAVAAPASGQGILTDNLFNAFANGLQTKSMVFDEVGIIHLSAELLTDDGMLNPQTYLSSGSGVYGNARNVGRFIPDRFQIETVTLQPRVRAKARATACLIPPTATSFNYLGEEFEVRANITARNFVGAVTKNYVGNYAKLGAGDFAASKFNSFKVVSSGNDLDFSNRVTLGSAPPVMTWQTNPETLGGTGVLAGNLILNRLASGEENPLIDIEFGLNTTDDPVDQVGFALGLTLDSVPPISVARFGAATQLEFRYGRLLIDNAYGPETEPLNIPFRVEYFNNSEFQVNTNDSCTSLLFDVQTPPPALSFVAGSYLGNLTAGDTVLEDAQVADVEVSLYEGRTAYRATGVDEGKDRPFVTSAPGIGNEGSVIVEFDLDHPSLPYSLDFLSYDWRKPGDIQFETPDTDYTDNPRSSLELDRYRGHDRVINWQEIFIGPNP